MEVKQKKVLIKQREQNYEFAKMMHLNTCKFTNELGSIVKDIKQTNQLERNTKSIEQISKINLLSIQTVEELPMTPMRSQAKLKPLLTKPPLNFSIEKNILKGENILDS